MSLRGFLAKLRRKRQRDLDDPKRLRHRYPQYQIGKGSYGDLKIHSWGEGTKFEMGAYCSIADGVQVFLGGEHHADWVRIPDQTDHRFHGKLDSHSTAKWTLIPA